MFCHSLFLLHYLTSFYQTLGIKQTLDAIYFAEISHSQRFHQVSSQSDQNVILYVGYNTRHHLLPDPCNIWTKADTANDRTLKWGVCLQAWHRSRLHPLDRRTWVPSTAAQKGTRFDQWRSWYRVLSAVRKDHEMCTQTTNSTCLKHRNTCTDFCYHLPANLPNHPLIPWISNYRNA